MTLRPVSLDDKYDLNQSHVFVTGYQALIRAILMQKERDRRAGVNTGGYLSGYRGSPLGGLDQQFMKSGHELTAADVKIIANTGKPTEGIRNVMDVFSTKGGTDLGGMVEAFAQTPLGKLVLARVGVGDAATLETPPPSPAKEREAESAAPEIDPQASPPTPTPRRK